MSLRSVLLVAMMGSAAAFAAEGFQEGTNNAGRGEAVRPAYTHVRSDNQYLIGLIRKGYHRSSAFRELIETLERSNVIVFVQPGLCAGGRIRSCLIGVAGSAHDRHIRIRLDPQHTVENGLIATAAHELQHAVEVAENEDVVDRTTLAALYHRIAVGRCGQGLSEECETNRALNTERTVFQQLQRRQTSAADPKD